MTSDIAYKVKQASGNNSFFYTYRKFYSKCSLDEVLYSNIDYYWGTSFTGIT